MKEDRKQEKGIALALIAYLLLEQAGTVLKSDGKYYKGKTKLLLNNLLQNSSSVFLNIKNLKNLILPTQVLNKVKLEHGEVEQEVMHEELNASKRIFINLAALYITANDGKIYDLERITNNLIQNKKVFTEEEVLDVLKSYINQTTPLLKLDENYLKTFVK